MTLIQLSRNIDRWNTRIGEGVAWLSLFMALTTFTIVILRYVFHIGWIWMQESVIYMHGTLFMLAGAYTLFKGGHVRVDIFYRPASRRYQRSIDAFGALFLLIPSMATLLYYSIPYVTDAWEVLEGSREAGGLPGVFLLKSIILIFPTLLILQGLSQLIQATMVSELLEEAPSSLEEGLEKPLP